LNLISSPYFFLLIGSSQEHAKDSRQKKNVLIRKFLRTQKFFMGKASKKQIFAGIPTVRPALKIFGCLPSNKEFSHLTRYDGLLFFQKV
jgi:hypothetical protein